MKSSKECCAEATGNAVTTLQLLGGFTLHVDGQEVLLTGDGRRLVAFLALQREHVSREFVAGNLWLEGSRRRAFGNLRSALWRVRNRTPHLVDSGAEMLRLSDCVSLDIHRAAVIAKRLFSGNQGQGTCEWPLELFIRELLPGWYDDFILIERESLRQQGLHALEAIAHELLTRGRHGAAMQAAMAAVRLDRLRESSHRGVIRIHIAEGNYSEAQRHYMEYTELIGRELGLAPSPCMDDLVATIPLARPQSDRHPQRDMLVRV